MISMRWMAIAATILIVGAADTTPAAADMASGRVLANTCFSCHGTDGKSVGGMPTIAGKTEAFIIEQLLAFKADQNRPTVMNRISKGFTEAEIKALAKYFAASQ